MPRRHTDEFTGRPHENFSALVLHNAHLHVAAEEGEVGGEEGGGQVPLIFLVSPSHFVYHSNENLVPLSMREQEQCDNVARVPRLQTRDR